MKLLKAIDSSDMVNSSRPTHIRYSVVALVVALAAVTYLDRVCISTLSEPMMKDLHLTKLDMSCVFSAFTLAYALFEIPTAWWGDRYGTRSVLTRIVVWWSTFTIATAAAFSHGSLMAIRFLFGIGEAGAWPNAARTFSRWVPASERGKVQGIFFAGAHLSGGVTPMIVTALLVWLPWRAIFVICGCFGFLWAIVWYRWFRDEPSQHPEVNEAEVELICQGRSTQNSVSHGGEWAFWKAMLTCPNVYALCAMYFSNSYGFYFLITWLPAYLKEQHGFDAATLGFLSGLPLMLSVAGDLTGGVTTDWVTRKFGLRMGRAAVGGVAYLLAAACMLSATLVHSGPAAAILIALAAAASMFTLAASWATCIDIGGNHSAVISAAMNTTGQLGGVISPILVAISVEKFSNWSVPIQVIGVLYLVSAACWCVIDPRKQVMTSTKGTPEQAPAAIA